MIAALVSPPPIPVLPERGGTQLGAPRAVVLVDTREQTPFDFSRFSGWFARVEKRALKDGDYTIAGLEDIGAVERKDLADLVYSFTVDRPAFINRLRLMSSFRHRLLVISAPLSQVKSPYAHSNLNPNRILQSLIAVLAGLNIPFLCTETHELGEEVVASYLYQIHLYDWLETNGYGLAFLSTTTYRPDEVGRFFTNSLDRPDRMQEFEPCAFNF
jgi:ERCC4-type nuclease